MVMWTVDGDIRDQLGDLAKSSQSVDDWYRRFDELLTRAQEMIYKEQNILFPICAENFTAQDWYQIYKDTAQYEEIFGVKRLAWTEAEHALAESTAPAGTADNTIALIGGTFTLDQLDAMLNTMPMEVTSLTMKTLTVTLTTVKRSLNVQLRQSVAMCSPAIHQR